MKWKTRQKRYKYRPTVGDERILKKFLIFPLSITRETRWLCTAKIKQVRNYCPPMLIDGQDDYWNNSKYTINYVGWHNISWVD